MAHGASGPKIAEMNSSFDTSILSSMFIIRPANLKRGKLRGQGEEAVSRQ